jgi:hypothetical protein
VNPACHSCGVTEIIDVGKFLNKVAELNRILPGLIKEASTHPIACSDLSCAKLLDEKDSNTIYSALQYINNIAESIKQSEAYSTLETKISAISSNLGGFEKYSGEQELKDLKTALDLVSGVIKKMIDQRSQIDMGFVEDLTKVMASLQESTSELDAMGFGRLPSISESGTPTQPGAPDSSISQSLPPKADLSPAGGNPGAGGSKIQTGPAGQVGTVTGPLANSKHPIKISKTKHIKISPKINKGIGQFKVDLNLS